MSLNRRTHSPLSNTYSYSSNISSNLSPNYSYSRVSTYIDALQRDQTISKLKRQITNVKSVQMKYHSLVQEISMAERQNRLLQTKNMQIENQYIEKIQQSKAQNNQLQAELKTITQKLNLEQRNVESVENGIQQLLEQLKQLKMQEQALQNTNTQLKSEVVSCNQHLSKSTQIEQALLATKSSLHKKSKQYTEQMQNSRKSFIQINKMVQNYNQELQQLKKQSQLFDLEEENMQILYNKNSALLDNLHAKVSIQEDDNQQLKTQLEQVTESWNKMQSKVQSDKQSLYDNIIKVEQKSLILQQTLSDLEKASQTDNTERNYLKDISSKFAKVQGENDLLRQLIKHLQQSYSQKKATQITLVEQINQKIKSDDMVKSGLEQRSRQLSKIKSKFTN